METFKQRIKAVCQHVGGQKSLAGALGSPSNTVNNWVSGKAEPSFRKITLICGKTGFNTAWLAFGEGPMRPGEEVPPPSAWEKEKEALETKVELLKEMAVLKLAAKQPPPVWEQEKAELEEKMRAFKHMRDNFEEARQEIEARKQEVEARKQEVERLKGKVEVLKEMKQLPPPPTAGGGVADMTLLGLAECGLEGWLLKKPLSAKAVCPADMNSAEDFAVIATGQGLFHAGIEPGFTCFCAAKSAPLVGDIVYVLKPSNTASLGLVRELEHKEKGSKAPWLVLQKWHDLDPKTGLREPYTLRENRDELEEIVPVIYVQRRPI